MIRYEIIIYWSEVDNIFVAEMPELKGCIAHGDTPDIALQEVHIVADNWLNLANENNWHITKPKGKLIFA